MIISRLAGKLIYENESCKQMKYSRNLVNNGPFYNVLKHMSRTPG